MHKKYTFNEWLSIFFKEWLLSTGSKAAGIAIVTAAIFRAPSTTQLPPELEKNIYSLFDLTNSLLFQAIFLATGLILLIAFFAREFSKKKDGFWYKVAKKRGLIATAANILFGAVLLPLVFVITAFALQNQPVSSFVALAVAYVIFSALLHWLSLYDLHPSGCLAYIVSPATDKLIEQFRYKVQIRLAHHVTYCKGAGPVYVLGETVDQCLILFVPLDFDPATLSETEVAKWRKFLKLLENEWRDNDVIFTRVFSPAIEVVFRYEEQEHHSQLLNSYH